MYRIIKNSWIWFSFSILLAIISIIAIATFGLKFGIDYKGGTVIQFSSADKNRVDLTKEVLGKEEVLVGKAKIISVQPKLSTAELIEDKGVEKGAILRLPPAKKAP